MPVALSPKNQEYMARIAGGEDPLEIIRQGAPRTTILRLAERVQRGDLGPPDHQGNGSSRPPRRPAPSPSSSDPSATVVRFTQEQIVLPGNLFLLYDHCRKIYPMYRATKSQWILDVIQCWAEERAEELGLNPMSWTEEPRMNVEEDPEDYEDPQDLTAGDEDEPTSPGLQARHDDQSNPETESPREPVDEQVLGEHGDSDGDEGGGEGLGDDGGGTE